MEVETTIRRTELTVEKTETVRIRRIRRFVYERNNGPEQDVNDTSEELDPVQKLTYLKIDFDERS